MRSLADLLPPPPSSSPWYSCAELARLIGRHPNTLRKYEEWGFIGAVPRAPNGYRRYSRGLALQALFSVTALRSCFQDWQGRRRAKALIAQVLAGDFEAARQSLSLHRAELEACLASAEAARGILESWRRGSKGPAPSTGPTAEGDPGGKASAGIVLRGEAARSLGIAPDTLRDWERNGLVSPRRLANGRRAYSPRDMERLALVRMLRQAGYSLMGVLHLLGGKTAIEDLSFARDRWDESLRGLLLDSLLLGEIVDELEEGRL